MSVELRLDPNFGTNGIASSSDASGNTLNFVSTALMVDSCDNIIVGGYTLNEENPLIQQALIKFDSNGNIDTNFGNKGNGITTHFNVGKISNNGFNNFVSCGTIDDENNIYLAGQIDWTSPSGNRVGVFWSKYNSNGIPSNNKGAFNDLVSYRLTDILYDNSNNHIFVSFYENQSDSPIVTGSFIKKLDKNTLDVLTTSTNPHGQILSMDFDSSYNITTSNAQPKLNDNNAKLLTTLIKFNQDSTSQILGSQTINLSGKNIFSSIVLDQQNNRYFGGYNDTSSNIQIYKNPTDLSYGQSDGVSRIPYATIGIDTAVQELGVDIKLDTQKKVIALIRSENKTTILEVEYE